MIPITRFVIPGAGSVEHVLGTALSSCNEMYEMKDACKRLHGRLTELFHEIQRLERKEQLPPHHALDMFLATIASFSRYLEHWQGKPLVFRVVEHYAVTDGLLKIYDSVKTMCTLFGLATLIDREAEWDDDICVMKEILAAMVRDNTLVLRDLQDRRRQREAILTLQFEMEQRAGRHSEEILRLMKSILATITLSSKTSAADSLPTWFFSVCEINVDSEPFASGPLNTMHYAVWGPGTKVAVKRFRVNASEVDLVAQLKIEKAMDIWHQFNHPNVIKMFGASHVSSPPFVVCEDAVHGDLGTFLSQPDKKRDAWRLFHQAALGLDYLHRKGVVHGNLKLNSILVCGDGVAKLTDFGLNAVGSLTTLSEDEVSLSSLYWRAPECLTKLPTFASDVYSLAVCMIKVATDGSFLDGVNIRESLYAGVTPNRPESMKDSEWELVVAMTNADPVKRIPLHSVIERLLLLGDFDPSNEVLEPQNQFKLLFEVIQLRELSYGVMRGLFGTELQSNKLFEARLNCHIILDPYAGEARVYCDRNERRNIEVVLRQNIDQERAKLDKDVLEEVYMAGTRVVLGNGFVVSELLFANEFSTLFVSNMRQRTEYELYRWMESLYNKPADMVTRQTSTVRSIALTYNGDGKASAAIRFMTKQIAKEVHDNLRREIGKYCETIEVSPGVSFKHDAVDEVTSALDRRGLLNRMQHRGTNDKAECNICTCAVEDDYVTMSVCNHAICNECFENQVNAASLPLTCCTDGCGHLVHVNNIVRGSTSKTVSSLVEKAVFEYVSTHKDSCMICPKPGCNQILPTYTKILEGKQGGRFIFCDNCFCYYCIECSGKTGRCIDRHDDESCEDIQSGGLSKAAQHVQNIQNKILNLCCPRCETPVLDFSGCTSVECGNPSCQQYFCANCLVYCSPLFTETLNHVQRCERNPGQTIAGNKSYFICNKALAEVHRVMRTERLAAYFTAEIKDERLRFRVYTRIAKDLHDLTIELPKALRGESSVTDDHIKRHVSHIREELLNLTCPACHLVFVDFDFDSVLR